MRFVLPSSERLRALVGSLRGQRLLLHADLVADRFIVGRANRISREAPVLILEEEEDLLVPGGGANAVANVKALGGAPSLVGAIGNDAFGRALLAELERLEISCEGILVREGYRTPTKTRILAGSATSIRQQIVRIDRGDPRALEEAERSSLLAKARAAAHEAEGERSIVVLSDYGYGTVEPSMVQALLDGGPTPNTILVDSRYRLREFRGCHGMTPNQEEAEALAGTPLESEEDLVRAGRHLRAELTLDFLLVTRGSRGMALFVADGCALIPVFGPSQVADVTGAGDTVIGTVALALAAGASALEAAVLANLAGGLVVMKAGTATVTPAELSAAATQAGPLLERVRWVPF